VLVARASRYAKRLEEAEPCSVSADTLFDQWHLELASVLFRSSGIYHYQRNGEVLRETPSQEEVYTQVGLILEVLQAAREAAGVTEGSLNEQQKKVWLDKWCTNHDLRKRHQLEEAQANDETHQLLPQERTELKTYRRNQKRGAFNAFLKQFVGNTHVAYMMLNHGFTTPEGVLHPAGESEMENFDRACCTA
jgi:hypothetical protein